MQQEPIKIGDKVERFRQRSPYYIREISANGWATVAKEFRDGKIIEMSNALHVGAVRLWGTKGIWRDKNGKTAKETAQETFKIGEHAIYTILGDIWCTILEIRENGAIIAETPSQKELFSPHLEYDGDWGWWNQSSYPLRKDDGHFREYDD